MDSGSPLAVGTGWEVSLWPHKERLQLLTDHSANHQSAAKKDRFRDKLSGVIASIFLPHHPQRT